MAPPGTLSIDAVVQACALIRSALGAEEAYVVRAGDPHFLRVDAPEDPTAYELKQKGYFLVWRELVSHASLMGGLFQAADRRVFDPTPLRPDVSATHLALLLPGDESNAEMLIARGPWPAGPSREQVDFAIAARPTLAYLVGSLLDAQRRQRQREQLHSLGAVATAVTGGQEMQAAMPAIATSLAKASGFDWVTISVLDESLDTIVARGVNQARHSETETAAISREGALHRDLVLSTARHLLKVRRPLLFPDAIDADKGRALDPNLRRFFERAHILSLATFPLFSGDRLIGTLDFTSSVPHSLDPAEVEFLSLLCEQAVMAIRWLQLHQELRDVNAALARAATHDALTGLPNRVLFLDRLTQALARAERREAMIAVLFIDLDDFKSVNDSLGHDAGDRVLQAVAERLRRHLRVGDTAARLGGDEFTIVLETVASADEVTPVARRLQSAIREPIGIAGRQLVVDASIGFACAGPGDINAEHLLRQADHAMYCAKASGKGRIASYQGEPNDAKPGGVRAA